jgi:proton-dependent oligopeptide transporter, POT family
LLLLSSQVADLSYLPTTSFIPSSLRKKSHEPTLTMPTGDALEVGGAELRAEAIDERKHSIAVADDAQRAASIAVSNVATLDGEAPTAEELLTLRRVPNHIPRKIFTIAFIELCERFSYYGTTVVFTNFIQHP